MKQNRKRTNPVLLNYLYKHGEEHTVKEWLLILNKKFNEDYKYKQLQQLFYKNQLPRKYEYPKRSHSNIGLPIGSERTKADGMVQVKVAPHKWEYKQRLIYEKYYNVELKDNEYVIFLDQDRNNFDIDNLRVVSAKVSGFMANQYAFSKNPEVTKIGIMATELYYKTKEN